jgi:NAD(P)-dependent dehydrogenase (short-subunit alcohol dehydrogenase family)
MVLTPLDLGGSTVLVTGASSGIGRETAILLSELNARLVLTARNPVRLEETRLLMSGNGHIVEPFDLSHTAEVSDWLRSQVSRCGPLNGLVHCAGTLLMSPARFVRHPDAEDLIRVNLLSAIMLMRGFCQKGCHAADSSVVLLSSIMGLSGAASMSVYGASKAALIGLSRSLAVEFAGDRIRVNCVAPGMVQTDMLEQFRELLSPEKFDAMERAHPLGFGTARDIANAVAFLLADTGRWITGSTLVVDGGYLAR